MPPNGKWGGSNNAPPLSGMFARFFSAKSKPAPTPDTLQVGTRPVPLVFVPHPRARRYLLRLQSDGVARVTVPRGGSITAAKAFVGRNLGWLEQQLANLARRFIPVHARHANVHKRQLGLEFGDGRKPSYAAVDCSNVAAQFLQEYGENVGDIPIIVDNQNTTRSRDR